MTRGRVLAVSVMLALSVHAMVQAQTNSTAALRSQLENFSNSVRSTLDLLRGVELRVQRNERVEDLVAFGMTNVMIKSNLVGDYAFLRRAPTSDEFRRQVLAQIAAACGSPGPKPTQDISWMGRLRSTMVPQFYNNMLLIIVSQGRYARFGKFEIRTDVEPAQAFYFPLLIDRYEVIVRSLPPELRDLVSSFELR